MRRAWPFVLVAVTLFAGPAIAQEGAAPAAAPAAEAKPAEAAAPAAEAKPAEAAAADPHAAAPAAEAKPAEAAADPHAAAPVGEAKPAAAAPADPHAVHGEGIAGAPVGEAKPAEPHGAAAAHAPAAHGEGHAPAAHGAGHGSEHPHGIVNWWSWDYGPTSKDPSHRHWPPPFGFALLNFGVFLALMMRLGGKPLREFVAARHERIKNELDEAGRLHREAEARLAELDKKLASLDKEVADILVGVRKEAEEDKARIIAAATQQAERIQKEAERQIEAEVERQRKELGRVVVEAAMKQAEALLQKGFTADDQKRTSDAYVAQLEKGSN